MSDKHRDETSLANEANQFSEKLKRTREGMGMSVQDAASRMNLSPRFILMLENENLLHCSLPRIYIRGYLRSYCRILNIQEHDLAPILEMLDPSPVVLEPVTTKTDSMSLSFPIENTSYYARIATVFVTLGILISVSTWWYSHANNSNATVVALNQPTVQEETSAPSTADMTTNSISPDNNAPLPTNTIALNNTAAPASNEVPAASIDLSKKPLNLAAAATDTNKAVANSKAAKEEDDDADEQE